MTRDYNIKKPAPGYTSFLYRLPPLDPEEVAENGRAVTARKKLHEVPTPLSTEQIEDLIIKCLHTHDDHILLIGWLQEEDY